MTLSRSSARAGDTPDAVSPRATTTDRPTSVPPDRSAAPGDLLQRIQQDSASDGTGVGARAASNSESNSEAVIGPAALSSTGPAGPLSLTEARALFAGSLVGRAPRTQRTYATALDRLVDFLAERGIPPETPTRTLPRDLLEGFYLWCVRRYGTASRSCPTYLAGARAFCRFLDRHQLAPDSYARLQAGLEQVLARHPYRTPRIDDQIPSMLLHLESEELPLEQTARLAALRDRAILRVLYTTAVRRDELVRLNREDVADGRASQALITGKGSRERVIFFDRATMDAIKRYLEARGDRHRPLFIRHDVGRGAPGTRGEHWRLSGDTVYALVKRVGSAVGSRATPHSFRHDRASLLLNRGADLSEVQDILGHASPETTKRIYAHYETSRLREAFDRYTLPPEKRVTDDE
ncbi:MAG: tyrosine-type recombinase/integrase [Chloroflexi bacterium]|nr:tyrosine-type recombinase/integrase [Chloroflexota bacterium]